MDTAPSLPALLTAELTRFRDERKMVVFSLSGGEKIEGAVRWFDEAAVHIVTPERDEVTLLLTGILYYQMKR